MGRERGGKEQQQQFLIRDMDREMDKERMKEIQGEAAKKEPWGKLCKGNFQVFPLSHIRHDRSHQIDTGQMLLEEGFGMQFKN